VPDYWLLVARSWLLVAGCWLKGRITAELRRMAITGYFIKRGEK